MCESDDRQLVEQARENPQAFAALYDRYVNRIYAYAYRQTQEEALAGDVTAVTFEKALRHIRQYEWQGKSFVAWLYRIARNEIVSQHRRRKWLAPWRQNGQTEQRATETAVQFREQQATLHYALARLPKRDQEILALRFFEGLSSEEVAETLNCSTQNVYVRLHRALQRLRRQLDALERTGEARNVSP